MEAGLDSKQLIKLFQRAKSEAVIYSEIKQKDEIIERHIEYETTLKKDMKVLNSIIRIPRICYKFNKAIRKKNKDAEAQKKEQTAAYLNLKEQISEHDKDEDKFIDHILGYIDSTYPNDKPITDEPLFCNTETLNPQEKED